MDRGPSINKVMVSDVSAERTQVCNVSLHKSTWSIMYGAHVRLSEVKKQQQGKEKYEVQNNETRRGVWKGNKHLSKAVFFLVVRGFLSLSSSLYSAECVVTI